MGRWLALVACIVALVACPSCHRRDAVVTDVDGNVVDPLAHVTSPVVLFFVGTTCPVSNRYAPEMRHIHEQFAPRGVTFHLVYPSATESPAELRAHVKEHALPFGALRDPGHVLVARAGVHVTPEVAVFLANGELAYHGRIDDRQVDFGQTRPEPTRRDLVLVLEAVLAGRPVETRSSVAIGCSIPPAH
jgi:hypothetical protein